MLLLSPPPPCTPTRQRSRLVLAAAMWSKPHLLALDEPTNYLDNDTLAALTHALRSFKHGGVIVISHNVKFVNALVRMHQHQHQRQRQQKHAR
jgi:ATPase subunit of ABC transporter with duplicated ATPase domains